MKHINELFPIILFVCLISCNDEPVLDIQEKENVAAFSYSKDIKVYDETMENNVTLKISSNNIDSLNTYLEYVDFNLVFNIEKYNANSSNRPNEGNELWEEIGREPSVEIELVSNDISNKTKNFFIGISYSKLKSDPFWPVPIAAPATSSDFLGIKNTGSVDLGARFNVKDHWYSSYKDVSSPNIRVLNPSEKYYCYSEGSYRVRVSIYGRRKVSTGVFENPVYFLAYNQSSYDQI
jgi:hypothetical protein